MLELSPRKLSAPVAPVARPALPVTRLRLTVRAEAALQLPHFAGSMLRGAFGHALLSLSPLPHTGDQPCAVQASCPYCQIFAAPPISAHTLQKFSRMPQAYVIEPPTGEARQLRAGQIFNFSLVLIGNALKLVPVVHQAWKRALHTGLGPERARCSLLNIVDMDEDPAALILREPWPDRHVTLRFYTPLRLQAQGRPVRAEQLTARTLLITLARRHQLLCDVHLGTKALQHDFSALVSIANTIDLRTRNLRWFDWGRYSQRQRQEMKLGGLLGDITLRGDLTPFARLLHLGQWLHVGKNATFGMGGYRLELASSPHLRTGQENIASLPQPIPAT